MSNHKAKIIAMIVIATLVGGCACPPAAPSALQPKAKPAEFSAGQWWLDREEFERGELDGLVVGDGGLRLADDALQGTFTSRAFDSGGTLDTLTFSMDLDGAVDLASSALRCTLQARTSPDGSSWTPWFLLEPDESDDAKDGDQASYGQIVPVTSGRYLQLRLILALGVPGAKQGGALPSVRSVQVDYVCAAAGPDSYQAKAAALPAQPEPGAPRPVIIPRAGWGAKEQMMTWKPAYRHPARIVIHHTVTPNHEDNPAATVRAIYYFHAITRKWGDIGYNYLIDWQGNIYEGRAGGEKVVGGHARGYNEGSVGVALMGTYTRDDISPAMRNSLVVLLAWLSARYGIDPQGQSSVYGRSLPNILGHRAVAKTTCPGDPVLAQLDELRAQVATLVEQHGGIAAVTATPAPTRPPPRATPTAAVTRRITGTLAVTLTTTRSPAPAERPTSYVTGTLAVTPTATPLALARLTETPQSTVPIRVTAQPEPTATPQSIILITGLEVWPYPPVANRPVTLAVHLVNVGPADLSQVTVQVMMDVEQAEGGQVGLAWQLDRLRAGQDVRLDLSAHDRLAVNAGRHRLAVRAAGRDEAGHVIMGEWGPLAVSVGPSNGDAPSPEGWRIVVQRWGHGLGQAWEAVQAFAAGH
jgi:hypothetical protein